MFRSLFVLALVGCYDDPAVVIHATRESTQIDADLQVCDIVGSGCDPAIGFLRGTARIFGDTTALTHQVSIFDDHGGSFQLGLALDDGTNACLLITLTTKPITRALGLTATEYATAATSPLNSPAGVAFDHGDLYVSEYGDGTIRRITSVAGTTSTLAMTVATSSVSTPIDQFVPALTAHVPISGIRVQWSGVETNEAVMASYSRTNPSGDASVAMRPGVVPGAYHVLASVQTIHGAAISGSPATFTITATVPAAGTIFTPVNAAHTAANIGQGIPGVAVMARISNVRGFATASDGTVYFTETSNHIRKLATDGTLSDIAGNGATVPLGDNGPALAAGMNAPSGIALDDTNHLLYFADQSDNRVRVVDLIAGTIWTFAGDGTNNSLPPYGDGQQATSAQLGGPTRVALFNGGLYIVDSGHTRIRRVELQSPNIISTVYAAGSGNCSGALTFNSCNNPACDLVVIGSSLYISGGFCGSTFGGNTTYAFARMNADTSFTLVAGGGASLADGVAATSASLQTPGNLAVNSAGDIYYIDGQKVRKISGGIVTTVAGTGTAGFSGDYGPGSAAQINNPFGIGMAAGDHLLIGDGGNSCVREVW